jgi:hypothetical protein
LRRLWTRGEEPEHTVVSHEAAQRYSLRAESRRQATWITGPTGVTVSLDTDYMLIGLWDWTRVEKHLRSGWRSIETQAPGKGEPLLKWRLCTRKMSGEEMHLDVCKGAGIETSEITHEAAAMAGLPRGSAYQVHVKGTRAGSDFRAKGVSIIRRTAARGTRSGELPAWERPDVLLGMEDAKCLEGYLHAGWCKD